MLAWKQMMDILNICWISCWLLFLTFWQDDVFYESQLLTAMLSFANFKTCSLKFAVSIVCKLQKIKNTRIADDYTYTKFPKPEWMFTWAYNIKHSSLYLF